MKTTNMQVKCTFCINESFKDLHALQQFQQAKNKICNIAKVNKCVCVHSQSLPILWNPMDLSPPGSSVHGIFQVRILELVSFPLHGIFPSQNRTHISCISCIGRWILYHCTSWESQSEYIVAYNSKIRRVDKYTLNSILTKNVEQTNARKVK